ncbi:hypothetical protein GCM10010106_45920 [Thermopolyspora flexuosa]|nr:DUF397 domain-containing protein [Thermopolyspora flexuosa]GGM92584.1 hypothetical protein GCM10010106_45920 [Thermopolyspora flexuosa]
MARGTCSDAEALFLIRDSKRLESTVLAFSPGEWDAFIAEIKSGKFDHMG